YYYEQPVRYYAIGRAARPFESTVETQPQLQPALLRLSAIISQYFTRRGILLYRSLHGNDKTGAITRRVTHTARTVRAPCLLTYLENETAIRSTCASSIRISRRCGYGELYPHALLGDGSLLNLGR